MPEIQGQGRLPRYSASDMRAGVVGAKKGANKLGKGSIRGQSFSDEKKSVKKSFIPPKPQAQRARSISSVTKKSSTPKQDTSRAVSKQVSLISNLPVGVKDVNSLSENPKVSKAMASISSRASMYPSPIVSGDYQDNPSMSSKAMVQSFTSEIRTLVPPIVKQLVTVADVVEGGFEKQYSQASEMSSDIKLMSQHIVSMKALASESVEAFNKLPALNPPKEGDSFGFRIFSVIKGIPDNLREMKEGFGDLKDKVSDMADQGSDMIGPLLGILMLMKTLIPNIKDMLADTFGIDTAQEAGQTGAAAIGSVAKTGALATKGLVAGGSLLEKVGLKGAAAATSKVAGKTLARSLPLVGGVLNAISAGYDAKEIYDKMANGEEVGYEDWAKLAAHTTGAVAGTFIPGAGMIGTAGDVIEMKQAFVDKKYTKGKTSQEGKMLDSRSGALVREEQRRNATAAQSSVTMASRPASPPQTQSSPRKSSRVDDQGLHMLNSGKID